MNLKYKLFQILIVICTYSNAQTPLALSQRATDDLIIRGYDLNGNGFIDSQEISSQGPLFSFRKLYNAYDGGDSYILPRLSQDLQEIGNSVSSLILNEVTLKQYETLGNIGTWEAFWIEIESTDSIIDIVNNSSSNQLEISLHRLSSYSSIKMNKISVSGFEQFRLDMDSIIQVDTLVLDNVINFVIKTQLDTIVVGTSTIFLSLNDVIGISYINTTGLNMTGNGALAINGDSTDIQFICVDSGKENIVNKTTNSNIYVSDNCSLVNATNQNTKLGNALVNATPSIDTNKDGVIQGWELAQADTVIIPNFNIDSLNGMYLASDLVYLDVNNNNLDTIDLSKFIKLKYLNASGNKISHLSFPSSLASRLGRKTSSVANSAIDTLILNNNIMKALDV